MTDFNNDIEFRNKNYSVLPPGSRVADILDAQADGPLGDYPCIKYYSGQDYENFTFKEFRDVVYTAAQAHRTELQKHASEPTQFMPVGCLSDSGKNTALNLFALLILNVTPVALSPRNSVGILVHLLKKSEAKVLIYEEEYSEAAKSCAEKIPGLELVKSIKLDNSLLQPKPIGFTPLVQVSPKDVQEHIYLIIHSSGSTSHPKLVHLSNRYGRNTFDRMQQNSVVYSGTQLLLGPLFHLFGIMSFMGFFFSGGLTSFPKVKAPMSRQILDDISKAGADILTCLPFQLKQMAEYCQTNVAAWETLSKLKYLIFAGAMLAPEICKLYTSKGITLQNGYGASEVGTLASSTSSQANPNCSILSLKKGVKYSLVNVEGDTAQLLIHHDDLSLATGVSPPGEGYLIGDRLKILRHGIDQDILEFSVLGRVDDTIVHVTGEKTNPVPLEEILISLPLIERCVMFGNKQLNTCLFVQLSSEAETVPIHDIIRQVNLQVDKANADAPSHSRIVHELVYILPFKTSKPIPVTAKGNVARAKAEQLFQDEINQLYLVYDTGSNTTNAPQKLDFDSIYTFIGQAFAEVTKKPINNEISFFDQGMDSLLAVKFRNILNSAYPTANLSVNAIYELETTATLTKHIFGDTHETKDLPFYQEQVDSFIKEYTNFPSPATDHITPGPKTNFLVTGANGSLGSFIIKDLLKHDDVGTIFCFSRAKTSEESLKRMKEGLQERGIQFSSEEWKHICAMPYVSDDEHLGLDDATYNEVFQSVDVIYHVAWRMDFLKGLPGFRDCVESTVNLLKISATSPRRPAFHFTSTVGATMPSLATPTIVEDKLHSTLKNVKQCNGYNLSKLVSEIICYSWADKFGFSLDIHRVGQVSGDTENGAWNTREHISLLIKAAQVMKMVPSEMFESINWIPVDIAAKGMVEIHYSPNNPHKSTINHIVNPTFTPWGDVIGHLQTLGVPCQAVDSATFLTELKTKPDYQNVDINPIASLTDFFTNILSRPPSAMRMETQSTCQRSPSIKGSSYIDIDLMQKYLSHWISIGFMDNLQPTA
ncbi:hypothetical protein DSO57_1017101 [Entomophthora muscae]|uniref:Uncharacterized protein n=1 Tax=Entomophthora muscae TaxID=34485 RepID=A0ACC2TFB3_9FUNG|nr:hypothetical protein DSO57_1017101 [Entomophthora muscae]